MWSWACHGGLAPQSRAWQRQGLGRGTAEALPHPVLLPRARQRWGSALRGPSTLGTRGMLCATQGHSTWHGHCGMGWPPSEHSLLQRLVQTGRAQ